MLVPVPKNRLLLGAATLLVVTTVVTFTRMAVGNPASTSTAPAYSTVVSIDPMPGRAGAYEATAEITNLATGELEAAPSITLPAEEIGESTSTVKGGQVVHFQVKVSPKSSSAEYEIRLGQGGESRVIHRGALRLTPP